MRRVSLLVSAGSALALVATGLALAATSAHGSHVYTLKADLTPTHLNPASAAKGRFDGVLVWSSGGAFVGPLPAGCIRTVPRRSGLPYRVACDNGKLIITPSKTPGWTLAWVLSFSHLSGPAMVGDIHTSLMVHGLNALQITLFNTTPTVVPARGSMSVASSQAKALLLGKDYAGVNTSKLSSEIRGTITSSAH
jgi:hypothetical protein